MVPLENCTGTELKFLYINLYTGSGGGGAPDTSVDLLSSSS